MAESYALDSGTYYIIVGWVLTGVAASAVALRLYSRTILTRSAGSDDLAIVLAVSLIVVGEVFDSFAVGYGFGKHQEGLSDSDVASIVQWEYVRYIITFLSFFFIRSSIMLFTLRLLPATRKWAARVTVLSFMLNFLITLLVVVAAGIKCLPFTAIYGANVPQRWCEPENITVITQRVSGILACIVDIITALLPAVLLWGMQIKTKTKVVLYLMFSLGIITAGLSIGRFVTLPDDVWNNDTSWRLITPSIFSRLEETAGIILACGPAVRQLIVQLLRNGASLPSRHRQSLDGDFQTTRTRMTFRDIFWYREISADELTTFTGALVYPSGETIVEKTLYSTQLHSRGSSFDKLLSVFSSSKGYRDSSMSATYQPRRQRHKSATLVPHTYEKNYPQAWPGASESPERKRIKSRYVDWDWPPSMEEITDLATSQTPTSFFREFDSSTSSVTVSPRASSRIERPLSLLSIISASPAISRRQSRCTGEAAHRTSINPPSTILESATSADDIQEVDVDAVRDDLAAQLDAPWPLPLQIQARAQQRGRSEAKRDAHADYHWSPIPRHPSPLVSR